MSGTGCDNAGVSEPSEEEILGRLPRTRPGRRSPRRDEAAQLRARSEARAEESSARAARASAERETAAERERAEPTPPPPQPGVGDALAGTAKLGVSVATGTAKLGLKAAGGALSALRGTIERR
jgi:hypothetical protein